MSWRDQLQQASFRGVEFEFETATSEIGRRTETHEYPLRDKPFVEDLGRKARTFSLDCFVIGDDYMQRRDDLIDAIEAAGSGTLVHPRQGSMQATITDCRGPNESTREGGMARFSITFTEAGEKAFPSNSLDTQAIVETKADVAMLTVGESFSDDFSVAGMPEFVALDALNQFDEFLGNVIGMTQVAGLIPAPLTDFIYTATSIRNRLGVLLRTPALLVDDLLGLFGRVTGLFELPATGFSQLQGLVATPSYSSTAAPLPAATTPSIQQQINNRNLVDQLVTTLPIISSAVIASNMDFPSYNRAVNVRDTVADQLDAKADVASDQVYPVLQDLRVSVIQDITARGADLARIGSYTPQATLPALVVAHNLYNDGSRAAEIIERNNIIHPGFVQGGKALEVLADG